MKRDEQIDIIIKFLLKKDNEKVQVVPEVDDTFEFFSMDFQSEGLLNTTPGVVSVAKAQKILYRMIANAMISNRPTAVFSGMGGIWDEKRLEKGIIFGSNGIGVTATYPDTNKYDYTLMAWVK